MKLTPLLTLLIFVCTNGPAGAVELTTDFDFSGQLSLGDCSGSIVRFTSDDSARAIALTNGHCIGMLDMKSDVVIVNKKYVKNWKAYRNLTDSVKVKTTRILYGIMQPHDVALVELEQSYADLLKLGVKARAIAESPLQPGDRITLATGLFRKATSCRIEAIVHRVKEDKWTNEDAYKYRDCYSEHGTSGSPLINDTGLVVGVNYSGNDDGEKCTFDNPCEVDSSGVIRVDQGASYGDPLHKFHTCLNSRNEFDPSTAGCLLPRG